MVKDTKKFTLWMLAWPIFLELFLQFLLGTADTLMVARISDDAAAVVGFSNNLFGCVNVLAFAVAGASGILIAQKIGAAKEQEARMLGIMSVSVSAVFGLLLSLIFIAAPRAVASALQLPDELLPLADTYLTIMGGGMILLAVMTALGTAIRNTGNTKGPMYIAIGMNIIHVIMNYGFIFGELGFPKWGLAGVALSGVISRLLATIVLFVMFQNAFSVKVRLSDFKLFDRKLFGDVVRIGWPIGLNSGSWSLYQLLLFTYLAMLGSLELAARTYMNTLESFCFMLGYSIAMAAQIQIAHLFGAGKTREAYHAAYRAMWIGLGVVLMNAAVLFLFGRSILGWFTTDAAIIELCIPLLAMNLLLQPGKMLNMAIGSSLNAVGDTRYVMAVSLTFMILIGTVLSYFVSFPLGYGLIGLYICMITDEYFRGAFALHRWKGQKLLRQAEETNGGRSSMGSGVRHEAALNG